MKPGSNDKKVAILITGEELVELKRFAVDMVEAFGLDRRIEKYSGKRPIGFYSWDLACLLAVTENALKNDNEYADKSSSGYAALRRLHDRFLYEYKKAYGWPEATAAPRK